MLISSNTPDPHDNTGDDAPIEGYLFPPIGATETDTEEIPTAPQIEGPELTDLRERLSRAEAALVAIAHNAPDMLADYPHTPVYQLLVSRESLALASRYLETMERQEFMDAWNEATWTW